MTDGIEEVFAELRREYLAEAPARLGELRKDLAALRAGEGDAWASLKGRFHRLAGSGGSYGYEPISDISREAEQWLMAHPDPDDIGFAYLAGAVGRLAAEFDAAGQSTGAGPAPRHLPPFGWRAALVGGAAYLATRLASSLRDAQYVVSVLPIDADPASIPASERPELIVILPGPGEDPREPVVRWTAEPHDRRMTVALVSDLVERELLYAPWEALDLLVTPARADAEVPRWARAFAREAAAPIAVLLIDPDPEESTLLEQWLGGPDLRLIHVPTAEAAMEAAARETPDAIVVSLALPGTSGLPLVRQLRRDRRFALTPIVALAQAAETEALEHALRAGADELLSRPLARDRLVPSVLHRVARARRLDEVVRRDPLTGFLTAGALRDELEIVLAFARREGERIAFASFDVDHFRRINEQHGHAAGDAILVAISRIIRERVRASDLMVRLGGEEFGVLLRSCGPQDGSVIAEQIRFALESSPPEIGGAMIPVRLSAGVAAYPDHAVGPRELLAAAERALREAKETGRDRVVIAG
jgi:diguanylate cyclase (GGDEF)-like protein